MNTQAKEPTQVEMAMSIPCDAFWNRDSCGTQMDAGAYCCIDEGSFNVV